METFLIKTLQLILALVILVTIHEFGHYLFARIFGIKVNRFYIFFNPCFSLLKYFPSKGKLQLVAWTKKIYKPGRDPETMREKAEEAKRKALRGDHDCAFSIKLPGQGNPEGGNSGVAWIDNGDTWLSIINYDRRTRRLEFWATAPKAGGFEPEVEKEEERALATFNVGKPRPVEKNGRPTWAATLYGIGWVPLGGYCDIAGMIDETKGADQLEAEPQSWEFRTKPAWQRFMVMFAGVLFNFLLAVIIYIGIAFHWGKKDIAYQDAYEGMDFIPALQQAGFVDGDILLAVNGEPADITSRKQLIDMVQDGARATVLRNHADTIEITMPKGTFEKLAEVKEPLMRLRLPVIAADVQGGMGAKEAGLKPGDRIVKVGADTVPTLSEFFPALDGLKGQTVAMRVLRDGEPLDYDVKVDGNGKIGIVLTPASEIYPVTTIKYTLLQSIPQGWCDGTQTLGSYVVSLKLLFTKSGVKQVGGFGTLGSLFPSKWDWQGFWEMTAFLSVILAFMNIIPIPGLDGGHILFLLWEMITRRKVSDNVLAVANTIGFFLLLLLLIYANANDLARAFQ